MANFTPETESKIRNLGKAIKLQLDFIAAADFTKPAEQQKLAQNGMAGAKLQFELMKELGLNPQQKGSDILNAIVKFAEDNGSDAGDTLKAQLPKIQKVETAVQSAMQSGASPQDLPRVIKKALQP